MKSVRKRALGLIACLAAACCQLAAQAVIYDVNRLGGAVIGFIETDNTLGVIEAANIVDYSLTIGAAGTFVTLVPGNSELVLGVGWRADPAFLTLELPAAGNELLVCLPDPVLGCGGQPQWLIGTGIGGYVEAVRFVVSPEISASFEPPVTLIMGAAAATPDTDEDGVPDTTDNCRLVANADQRDSNGDGFGNVCDGDLNGDCLTNVLDLGILRLEFFGAGPDADFNGDGVVNVTDLGVLRTLFFLPPGPNSTGVCP